jgi:hypothetical protein
MKIISEIDKAYAAATIDCEGWIGIVHGVGYNRKHEKYLRYACTVRVGTTSKDLTDWLQQTFGGGVYFRKSQKDEWKDQWYWVLGSAKLVIPFLTMILPHLKIKSAQANLALEYLANKQKNNPEWRAEMKLKMHALNRKGKLVETNTLGTSEKEVMRESELCSDVQSGPVVIPEASLAMAA